jgi:hypothetical protein
MNKISIFKKQFDYYKVLADKSIDQLDDDKLFEIVGEETNSIAILMKHIAGNMLSRWTNIFEEDGEKSWRNRDDEFVDSFNNKAELIQYWKKGWSVLDETLDQLKEEDLDRIIYIRNMGCSVHDAIIRQLCHYPYHVGQIIFLAKYFKGKTFKSLSIPRGTSTQYNDERFVKDKSIKHFTDDVNSESEE